MESLTKTQLVLLTLLISFVTSIATGIMASSLLQAAPTNVTQTINRVVERTIEKVSESTGTKEIQVISEDEKVTTSIEKNNLSLVRISQADGSGNPVFYSLGVVINKGGDILAPRLPSFNLQGPFMAVFSDGASASISMQKEEVATGVVSFRSNSVPPSGFTAATFSKSMPKFGQTIILLEGAGSLSTLVGRVVNIDDQSSTSKSIGTDLDNSKETIGGIIIDLSGNIVGIRKADMPNGKTFSFAQPLVDTLK